MDDWMESEGEPEVGQLDVVEKKVVGNQSAISVRGEVVNVGSSVESVLVKVMFRDDQGTIVGGVHVEESEFGQDGSCEFTASWFGGEQMYDQVEEVTAAIEVQ